MKSNLDVFFKTDEKAEVEGIWFMVTDTAGFLVKRFGGKNSTAVKHALALKYKPFARLIENDSLPEDKQAKILSEVFVDASVIGWKGIEIEGEIREFSKKDCIELFCKLPDLFKAVYEYAQLTSSFKEDLGNY